MKRKLWPLLIVLSLPFLATCTSMQVTSAAPAPLWMDRCTLDWPSDASDARTMRVKPDCVKRWEDKYDRQQNLLDDLQEVRDKR